MEGSALELTEILEEYGNKRRDVFCGIFCSALGTQGVGNGRIDRGDGTHNGFSVLSIGETDPYRLVDKEDVCVAIPCERIEGRRCGILDPAWSCNVVCFVIGRHRHLYDLVTDQVP